MARSIVWSIAYMSFPRSFSNKLSEPCSRTNRVNLVGEYGEKEDGLEERKARKSKMGEELKNNKSKSESRMENTDGDARKVLPLGSIEGILLKAQNKEGKEFNDKIGMVEEIRKDV
ncbi:hypothetical protein ACH5RR_037469 [Cinchona calisaya]|uniref:Uncharacterized protein n=1 Tax=Cinchona calisaya TaxID=153742 RepID=A0ABD2YB24_9GENT